MMAERLNLDDAVARVFNIKPFSVRKAREGNKHFRHRLEENVHSLVGSHYLMETISAAVDKALACKDTEARQHVEHNPDPFYDHFDGEAAPEAVSKPYHGPIPPTNAALDMLRKKAMADSAEVRARLAGMRPTRIVLDETPPMLTPDEWETAKSRVDKIKAFGEAYEAGVAKATTEAATKLSTDAAARKALPVCTGVLDYFPRAIAAVAEVSRIGNDQHNPGQPLHWAMGKSTDHADCAVRHLLERGTRDTDGGRHSAKAAWRVLALLEVECLAEEAGVSFDVYVKMLNDKEKEAA